MKKFSVIALSTAALFSGMLANGQARDGSVMIDKENRQAVVITINQPENITSDALNQRLQQSGLKAKTRKGLTRYNRATLSEISPDQLDIYTKVEKATNNTSTVYMAVSRGYNGFTNSTADSTITVNIKNYLDAFVKDADYYSADVEIGNRITDVNREEKMYQQLMSEQKDLEKKKADIESRISEIQRELKLKEDNINKKKSDLETARAKRNISSIH